MQDVELIVAVEKQISVRRGWFGSDHVRAPAYRLDLPEREMVEQFWREFSGFLDYRR
jgi:4-hydroxy-tetrahydrodipicolinate synthase